MQRWSNDLNVMRACGLGQALNGFPRRLASLRRQGEAFSRTRHCPHEALEVGTSGNSQPARPR